MLLVNFQQNRFLYIASSQLNVGKYPFHRDNLIPPGSPSTEITYTGTFNNKQDTYNKHCNFELRVLAYAFILLFFIIF